MQLAEQASVVSPTSRPEKVNVKAKIRFRTKTSLPSREGWCESVMLND